MKKFIAVLLLLTMVISMSACKSSTKPEQASNTEEQKAGATPDGENAKETETPVEKEKLIVQTMATFNGVLCMYIRDKGWPEEAGLDIEYQTYASGAPANEALAAGLWDVGFQGAAYVFGVINNDAKIIGNYEDTGGDTLFVRKDSPILGVKGYNPTYPDIYGDPETVKGATILYAAGTSLHQLVLEYLEKVGLSTDDVNLVPMDYQTGLQTFVLGEGDIVALPTPWSLTVEKEYGWKEIANLRNFTTSMGDVIASKDAYENKRDALIKYMKLVYRAADELEADHDLKAQQIMKWYAECGKETTEETAKQEAEMRVFITSDKQKSLDYGSSESKIADFFALIGKIEPDQAEMFKANVVDDIWKEALAQ
jgi:ABC-type nitrate/sulfonate/bicarbonate transport system substrate-binding protein